MAQTVTSSSNLSDLILVHSHGKLAPRLIGFGQRLHHKPEYAYWTHVAVYVGPKPYDDYKDYI